MIYTGPVDEFFDYRFGKLPYRSLEFRYETHDTAGVPGGAGRQLPERARRTRASPSSSTSPGRSTRRRASCTSIRRREGDPYYPVPRPENAALYQQYQALADATPGVHFVGRLATYKYYNMDQVVAQALTLFARMSGAQRSKVLAASA